MPVYQGPIPQFGGLCAEAIERSLVNPDVVLNQYTTMPAEDGSAFLAVVSGCAF